MPDLNDVLSGCEYDWVAAQADYSTDMMFESAEGLREPYPRLHSHGTLCSGATEVVNFLGRKLLATFQGEGCATDQASCAVASAVLGSSTASSRTG